MRLSVLSFFSGAIERGVEVYVSQLVSRLGAQVLTPAHPIRPYSGTEPLLLRRVYLDKTSRAIFKATQRALSQLHEQPPDFLYPVNNGWQSILCKLFCLRHPKTKLILAGHSGPGWDDRVNLWLCPDVFVAFSRAQAQWARGVNPKARIEVIPHAVDLDQFRPGESSLKLHLQPPIFVTVSALTRQGRAGETNKNITATINAVSKLKRGSLLLLGGGPDTDRINQLAKSKLPDKRYLQIIVSHNIINQYYQVADVFTLASSTSESFGIAYLEALACNLPVVTIDDDLRREIIGPAGVFVKDPNNASEYARGLATALSKKWGNTPRLQAQTYSWDNTLNQYQQLFTSL